MKKDIRSIPIDDLKKVFERKGYEPYKASQVFAWLNKRNDISFEEMSDIPAGMRSDLNDDFFIERLECEKHLLSKDGTEKFLWRLRDDKYVETVLVKDKKRRTLCLSTQVGCRFRCPFCASGAYGFKRNLSAGEITGQIIAVKDITNEKINNIVFMGMGEPLDNYANLVNAIYIINHPKGMAIGARKITISTCGLVPGIIKLKNLDLQVELSVSLHATRDDLRDVLVPVNRKYPLGQLISACKNYYNFTKRVITLEYALISDKNDSLKDAESLARIAKDLKAKVNLIKCNTREVPDKLHENKLNVFYSTLKKKQVNVTIRKSKGEDILAACGQLAAGSRTKNEV